MDMTNTPKLSAKPRSHAAKEALRTAIASRTPFTTHGALSGEAVTDGCVYTYGQMPASEVERLTAVQSDVDYLVRSYRTPIAWHTTDGRWHVTDVRYSATTTSHTSQVYSALAPFRVPADVAIVS